uniref:Cadherin domain-containing protein n=1 Tax=Laticauda laticaudata TaxID=8630 RepID=A0A8C5RSB1_LATLA
EMTKGSIVGNLAKDLGAEDADIGINSLQNYQLSSNPYFILEVEEGQDRNKFADLVLQKPLDRESQDSIFLILTAIDGGEPRKNSTVQILINITDVYRVGLTENAPIGTTAFKTSVSDDDEGINAQIRYRFRNLPTNAQEKLSMNPIKGMITLIKILDFEEAKEYIITVTAKDGGGLGTHCKVQIQIVGENDNYPEITVVSLFTPLSENSRSETLIALMNVKDKNAGDNGKITCYLQDAFNTEELPISSYSF